MCKSFVNEVVSRLQNTFSSYDHKSELQTVKLFKRIEPYFFTIDDCIYSDSHF